MRFIIESTISTTSDTYGNPRRLVRLQLLDTDQVTTYTHADISRSNFDRIVTFDPGYAGVAGHHHLQAVKDISADLGIVWVNGPDYRVSATYWRTMKRGEAISMGQVADAIRSTFAKVRG